MLCGVFRKVSRKMFRVTNNAVKLIGNVLKTKSVVFDKRYYRAIIKLPDSCISKAFCSQGNVRLRVNKLKSSMKYASDSKSTLKTPLASLIAKEAPTQASKEDGQDDEEAKQKREQSWRRMKYTLMFFGFSFTCIGAYLIMELGKPRIEDDGTAIVDEFTNMPIWKQYVLRTISELDYYRRVRLSGSLVIVIIFMCFSY